MKRQEILSNIRVNESSREGVIVTVYAIAETIRDAKRKKETMPIVRKQNMVESFRG